MTGPVGSKSPKSWPQDSAFAVVTILQPSPITHNAPKNFRRDLSILFNDISGSAATYTAHFLRPVSALNDRATLQADHEIHYVTFTPFPKARNRTRRIVTGVIPPKVSGRGRGILSAKCITPIFDLGHCITLEFVWECVCGHLALLASRISKQCLKIQALVTICLEIPLLQPPIFAKISHRTMRISHPAVKTAWFRCGVALVRLGAIAAGFSPSRVKEPCHEPTACPVPHRDQEL